MPESRDGEVVITPLDLWQWMQKLDRRVARIERFVYTVTGGGIVVGVLVGWIGEYLQKHVG